MPELTDTPPELTETANLSLLDRREFTLQFVLAVLSGATITVVPACGGGSGNPSSPSPNPGGNTGVTGSVTANHGHRAVIENAKLSAGLATQLDIRGDADHPHTISLTANQVMQIAARQRVSVESTTDDAHAHTVIFNA
jgi:hypothetical protein